MEKEPSEKPLSGKLYDLLCTLHSLGSDLPQHLLFLTEVAQPQLPSDMRIPVLGRMFEEVPQILTSLTEGQLENLLETPPPDAVSLRLLLDLFGISEILDQMSYLQLLHLTNNMIPPGAQEYQLQFLEKIQEIFSSWDSKTLEHHHNYLESTPLNSERQTLLQIEPTIPLEFLHLIVELLKLSLEELHHFSSWIVKLSNKKLILLIALLQLDASNLLEIKTRLGPSATENLSNMNQESVNNNININNENTNMTGIMEGIGDESEKQGINPAVLSLPGPDTPIGPNSQNIRMSSDLIPPPLGSGFDENNLLGQLPPLTNSNHNLFSSQENIPFFSDFDNLTTTTTTIIDNNNNNNNNNLQNNINNNNFNSNLNGLELVTQNQNIQQNQQNFNNQLVPLNTNSSMITQNNHNTNTQLVNINPTQPEQQQLVASGLRLRIVRQPPPKTVYQRILKQFPSVMLENDNKEPTNNLFVEVVLLRSDSDQQISSCIEGNRVVRISNGSFATFKKLKLLSTTQQQGTLFRLKFIVKRYIANVFVDTGVSVISDPIEVFSHTLYLSEKQTNSATPSITEILPSAGPSNTRVVILGSNFINSPNLKVSFGKTAIGVTFHEKGTLICEVPPQPDEDDPNKVVRVSNDGVHYCESPVVFSYQK